ncbi:MAG: YtxH domain-containing protein [Bacteroidetes bacterium]|nr:YtxH domain-containing protein [Bacteroidota bacterium]HET6244740.1 YtxH domain-containing protein [Bacteroidia bacterium]
MKIGRIFVALLSGLATGVIYGILYAPGKGSETRKRISESSKKLAVDGVDAVKELGQKITHFSHLGNGHNGHEKNE